MEPTETLSDSELQSLREWLASWPDGPNWSDATGVCIPIARETVRKLLNTIDALRAARP